MKITTEQLKQLYEEYDNEITLKCLNDTRIQQYKLLSGDIILKDHVDVLARTRIQYIEVLYDSLSYQYLHNLFPGEFRLPEKPLKYMDFDRYLESLDRINMGNQKKRYVYIVGDRYFINNEGKTEPLLSHDEPLDYKKWNILKKDFDHKATITFRKSEGPVIVLVNLTQDSETEYVERFKKNTDLISILVSDKNSYGVTLSPSFVPTEDIISVTDPGELLDTYIRTEAHLVIIGEKLDEYYKKALINVKKYDKYIRMMIVPEINQRNLDHFLKQLELVYKSDRW